MSRSAAAWQARLVKAYCSRQSSGLPGDSHGPVQQVLGRDEFADYAERVGLAGGEDLTEQRGTGRDRLAPSVGEHADVDRGHRMPIGTSLCPKEASLVTAMRWSQTAAVMSPPAKAWPLMAATVGRG